MRHGTEYAYSSKGCRCVECRSYRRRAQGLRVQSGAPADKHGRASTYYRWGCRCADCKAAHSAYLKVRRAITQGSDPKSHGVDGYVRFGCRCDVCASAMQAAASESRAKSQSASLTRATSRGKQWTGPELEVAARAELTAPEVAALLNRTVFAVNRMRERIASGEPKILGLIGAGRGIGDAE